MNKLEEVRLLRQPSTSVLSEEANERVVATLVGTSHCSGGPLSTFQLLGVEVKDREITWWSK